MRDHTAYGRAFYFSSLSTTLNTEPSLLCVVNEISPPAVSTMFLVIESPSPMPVDFVVKLGIKTLS